MENSEQQQQVINLGKLFVKELGLEHSSDTFSRWMAHYIAEKITASENTTGPEKATADKECFETILKLWEHRWLWPSGRRPLENFAPILNLLQKLNPDREHPYYYPTIPLHEESEECDVGDPENVENPSQIWLKMAEQVDKIARVLIDTALATAAKNAKNESTKDLLENAVNLPGGQDVEIIRALVNDEPNIGMEDLNTEQFERKYEINKIHDRIKQLETFSKYSEFLLNEYRNLLNLVN